MFYDKYVMLCKAHGVSPSKAALDAGISKSLVTKWRTNQVAIPSPEVLRKLSDYFSIPISELMGEEKSPAPAAGRDGSEILFALSMGGRQEITEEMYEEVRRFASYIAQRESEKSPGR